MKSKQEIIDIRYKASKTVTRMHRSKALYRYLMGPVRSGKTVGCAQELGMWARSQEPAPDGLRYTSFAVLRKTYRELKDTTLRTWLQWYPERVFGEFHYGDMVHRLRYNDVVSDVYFRALERPADAEKLLSLELTGAHVNEGRQMPKRIIDTLGDRVGQYPQHKTVGYCTKAGVIIDTNMPDDDHWLYKQAEEVRPVNAEFFKQPGGLIELGGEFLPNPRAENIENLIGGYNYYMTRTPGKSLDYVRVYYCGQYGFVIEGKPVHGKYIDTLHCANEILDPVPGVSITVGLDFGLTPAAVFIQQLPNGRYIWIDEIVSEDMDTTELSQELNRKINADYQGFTFEFYGDPSGDIRAQTDKKTCFQILNANGIDAEPTFTNDPEIRRGAVSIPMGRLIEGKPGLMISPKCKMARKGLKGGFCYKRIQVAGDERYHDVPDKNRYSHVVEAGEYGMIGLGEGEAQIEQANNKPVSVEDYYGYGAQYG